MPGPSGNDGVQGPPGPEGFPGERGFPGPAVSYSHNCSIQSQYNVPDKWNMLLNSPSTVEPHLSGPHLSRLFTYTDTCLGTIYDYIYRKCLTLSGYSVIRTVSLGTEVHIFHAFPWYSKKYVYRGD